MEIRKSKQPYIFFQQHLYRPPKKDVRRYKQIQTFTIGFEHENLYEDTHKYKKKERKKERYCLKYCKSCSSRGRNNSIRQLINSRNIGV
jgi:hypothetical protein